jgi:peroxiredoxin
MFRTIVGVKDSVAWHKRYGPQAPKAGDLAPDFELRDVGGENPVRLSDFKGRRPVVLVFGSFT